ncbi:MAG: pilus assembly protein [Dermatophilaceae bacterium]|nr:pilus assembly protein [Dermatophilaceae bacterium]
MRGPVVIAQQLPLRSRRRHQGHLERGAVAVEMAMVLPLLLFVFMGIIDFGRAYSTQIQLSAAAREGVRLASLNTTANTADANYGNSAIQARVRAAAGGVPDPTVVNVAAVPASCPATANSVCVVYCPVPVASGSTATVVVTTQFTWITGIKAMSNFFGSGVFPTPTSIQVTGVMRCSG